MTTLGVADSKAAIDSGTITGATINNCVIGATTPVAGSFTAVVATNITATGNVSLGDAVTDTLGFYGTTPAAQVAGAAQAALTDASGGAAAATNGILTLTGTYNSTILANAIATLAAQTNAIRNALVSVGLIKGAA